MVLTVRNFFILSLVFTIATSLIGCDKVSDFFEKFSTQQKMEDSEPLEPSFEKTLLMDILENQKELIEQMKTAHAFGDKRLIKESYEEILRLDKNYQEEFKRHEDQLSSTDSIEISERHYKIVKSIPQYSKLLE